MKNNLTLPSSIVAVSLVTLGALYAPPPPAAPLAGGATPINSLPFDCATSGAYCVNQNLQVDPNLGGLTVSADNVSIDLGGFTLDGLGHPYTAIDGSAEAVEVRNGFILNWGLSGVKLGDFAKVENVVVRQCQESGIDLGWGAQVSGCRLYDNVQTEIRVGSNSQVTDCIVTAGDFSAIAVKVGVGSTVSRCQVTGGEGAFFGDPSSRFQDCTARNFTIRGFGALSRSLIEGCIAKGEFDQAEEGIWVDFDSQVIDCFVSSVDVGVKLKERSRIAGSTVSGTKLAGISAGAGSQVEDCVVQDAHQDKAPDGAGILAYRDCIVKGTVVEASGAAGIRFMDEGGAVLDCDVYDCEQDGICVGSFAVVEGNRVRDNAGIGIHVVGDRLRIQDNTIGGNDRGLVIEGHDSLVVGNRAADNPNGDFDVPYGNPLGPINKNSGTIQGSVPQANFKTPL